MIRIGYGYDVHRLVWGRRLVLGGIEIASETGLDGHSDADVLTHAIIDALLGAAAMGDIGALFPDTDEAWKDADSIELLKDVCRRLTEAGYSISNIDATVVMERPKLRPYIDAIRKRLSTAMQIDITQVSVKATTSERMGFVGVGDGAAAHAVCLLGGM